MCELSSALQEVVVGTVWACSVYGHGALRGFTAPWKHIQLITHCGQLGLELRIFLSRGVCLRGSSVQPLLSNTPTSIDVVVVAVIKSISKQS